MLIVIVTERDEKRAESREQKEENESENEGREKERRRGEREAPRAQVHHVSVCTFKRPPCVLAKCPHVFNMRAFCRYTRRRFECTHGGVNLSTGGFPLARRRHTQRNTPRATSAQDNENKTRQDKTRHDTTRHDTTRHETTRHDTTRHDTTRHDTTRHDTQCTHITLTTTLTHFTHTTHHTNTNAWICACQATF